MDTTTQRSWAHHKSCRQRGRETDRQTDRESQASCLVFIFRRQHTNQNRTEFYLCTSLSPCDSSCLPCSSQASESRPGRHLPSFPLPQLPRRPLLQLQPSSLLVIGAVSTRLPHRGTITSNVLRQVPEFAIAEPLSASNKRHTTPAIDRGGGSIEPARTRPHHVSVSTLFRGPVPEAPAAGSRQARAPPQSQDG